MDGNTSAAHDTKDISESGHKGLSGNRADGMVGKVGYVYQTSNFIYAGYSEGEMYMKDGVKIHVRQMKSFLVPEGQKDYGKTYSRADVGRFEIFSK